MLNVNGEKDKVIYDEVPWINVIFYEGINPINSVNSQPIFIFNVREEIQLSLAHVLQLILTSFVSTIEWLFQVINPEVSTTESKI